METLFNISQRRWLACSTVFAIVVVAQQLDLASPLSSAPSQSPLSLPGVSTETITSPSTKTLTKGSFWIWKDPDQRWSSFIGIVTAIVGNILISFALNIQRYAHIRIERDTELARLRMKPTSQNVSDAYGTRSSNGSGHHTEEIENGNRDRQLEQSFLSDRTVQPGDFETLGERKNYLRSPYWWCGIILMLVGEAGNFLAYGFAPASIVSPLGVVALISNCVIAPFMLKESFRKRDFWGVLIAIGGAVVVVLSAKTSETKIGPNDIWRMITRWEFETYLGITVGLILILMAISWKHGGTTILIDVGLVALFGGYTALSTKGVASLLSFTLWHVITFPVTYLLVTVLVFTALMQIRYINRALQRFDSTQVIPTQFVLFTLSVIIGSAVLYRDFESTTSSQAGKFVGGCFMTFLGVYLITSGRVRTDDERSYFDEEDEARVGLLQEGNGSHQQHAGLVPDPHSRSKPQPERLVYHDQVDLPASFDSMSPSTGSDEDGLRTPRGVGLSPVASSPPEDSFSDRSASPPGLRLRESDSPRTSDLSSLMGNPWVGESPSRTVRHAVSMETPSRAHPEPPQAPMLLRFPSAPTGDEDSTQGQEESYSSTVPEITDVAPSDQGKEPRTPRTPQSSSARNSISLRFTPAPLVVPLSSTLSAVVAESLRRGEGSPGSYHRRTKTHGRQRKSSAPPLAFGPLLHEHRNASDSSPGPSGTGGSADQLSGTEGRSTTTAEASSGLGGMAPIDARPTKRFSLSTPEVATSSIITPPAPDLTTSESAPVSDED